MLNVVVQLVKLVLYGRYARKSQQWHFYNNYIHSEMVDVQVTNDNTAYIYT